MTTPQMLPPAPPPPPRHVARVFTQREVETVRALLDAQEEAERRDATATILPPARCGQ